MIRRARHTADFDGLDVEREAALLAAVRLICPLPVPRPLRCWPEDQSMELSRIPGRPALAVLDDLVRCHHIPAAELAAAVRQLGGQLGELIAALAGVPIADASRLVDVDDTTPAGYLDDLRPTIQSHLDDIPDAHRDAVRRFLTASAPDPPLASELRLTHHDLGAEHVFIRLEAQRTMIITGVIDWSDAAIADPALDLGLIRRDLGQAAFDQALRALPTELAEDAEIPARALFYGRVRALEDVAYGIESGGDSYRRNALRALDDLFSDDPAAGTGSAAR